MIRTERSAVIAVLAMVCVGCSSPSLPGVDAGAAPPDASPLTDASPGDAGRLDGGWLDASGFDGGDRPDAGVDDDAGQALGAECASLPPGYAKQLCLKPWIQDLARRLGPADALCQAEELLERGEVSDCHLLAHFVGEVVFEQQEQDAARSLVACPATCLSGCGHQVMQEVVEQRGLNRIFREQGSEAVDQELRQLVRLCRDYEDDDPDQFALCIHGIGHGLLSSGFLGPVEAAELCDQELGVEGFACASGVFMEYTSRYIRLDEAQLLESLPTICELGGNQWEDLCWRNVGESLMWFYGHQLERVVERCNRLPVSDDAKACREGAEVEAGVADMQRNTCP